MAVSGHMIISGAVPIAIIIAVVARIISGVAVVVIPAGTDRNRSVGTTVSVGHASGKGQAGDQQRGQHGRERKSVVAGKSVAGRVGAGGCRDIKTNKQDIEKI